jgi:hypothetical protein
MARTIVFAAAVLEEVGRIKMDKESEPAGFRLRALVALIKASPIVARVRVSLDWARVRRSPEVDAFVLAWIASHVRGRPRPPRSFM